MVHLGMLQKFRSKFEVSESLAGGGGVIFCDLSAMSRHAEEFLQTQISIYNSLGDACCFAFDVLCMLKAKGQGERAIKPAA